VGVAIEHVGEEHPIDQGSGFFDLFALMERLVLALDEFKEHGDERLAKSLL